MASWSVYARVGFIITQHVETSFSFYNKRGTCEQWVEEGKSAIKWTRPVVPNVRVKCGAAPASVGYAPTRIGSRVYIGRKSNFGYLVRAEFWFSLHSDSP
jgi:hypothetical protein